MIGQPPRQKGEGFDQRELSRWFDDLYRHLKTTTSSSSSSVEAEVTNVTKNYGSSSTTIEQTVIGTSKRYLRWINC